MIPIIVTGCVGTESIIHYSINDALEFFVSGVFMESFLHCFLVEFLETFHLAVRHHRNSLHDLFFVFSEELEGEEEKHAEVGEDIRIFAFHEIDVVLSQLEWRSLEVHIAWRTGKHETKVDMDDMAFSIDKNIVVVTIFDLEKILDNRISCQRVDEVSDRLFVINAKELLVDLSQ